MSNQEIESKIKKLVEERKYDEARELLKSSYSLSDEQAVAFIKKLEGSAKSQSKVVKPGIAAKLAKGCGCFSIFFLVIGVWSIYSVISDSNDYVKVTGIVVSYDKEETTNNQAKILTKYNPIVTYGFEGKEYRDTIILLSQKPEYPINSSIELYISASYPDYVMLETSVSPASRFLPWIILSILSYLGYRFLRNFTFSIKASGIGKSIEELKEAAATIEQEQDGEGNAKDLSAKGFIATEKPKYMSPKAVLAIGLGFIALGAGLIYYNYSARQKGDRIAAGDTITGLVTKEHISTPSKSSSKTWFTYYITYEYNGDSHEYETSMTRNNYDEGDKVEMKINPNNPDEVAINIESDMYNSVGYLWIAFFLGLGGLIFSGGIKYWRKGHI